MFCTQCGSQLASGIKFCTSCGNPVASDVSGVAPFTPEFTNTPREPRKPVGKWVAIGAGALVAVLAAALITNIVIDGKYLKPEKSPLLANSLSSIKVDAAAEAKCNDLAAALPSDPTVQAWNSRAQVMNKYIGGAARRVKTFVDSTAWIDATELPDINADMDAALAGGLDDIIAKTDTIRASDRQAFADLWAEDFKTLAVEKCGLTTKLAVANDAEKTFRTAKNSVTSLAASVPWYPDGYTEWTTDSNVAYKWDDNPVCTASGGWCWQLKVIAATGCANGLDVSMDLLDSAGTVIDSTSGSLTSLGAMRQDSVELDTYEEAVKTGTLTTISCQQ
jgi:hypothetical protein